MKSIWKKKIMKIIGASVLVLLFLFSAGIYSFSKRKSDKKITKIFQKKSSQIFIKHLIFKNKDIRVFEMQKKLDTTLPILVFVHGSPGSALDFKKYFLDAEINQKYNIMSYDRIGYSDIETGKVLSYLNDEVDVLHEVLKNINLEQVVLLGYSYGGTIAMASTKRYKKKIILAGAVKGDLEPMFWALNLFEWKLTRPLVPKVFQAAAQEKLQHVNELSEFENIWNISESSVLTIHGKKDRIVPFENSLFLKEKMDKNKFTLLPIEKGNHSLVWTNFGLIKAEILNVN